MVGSGKMNTNTIGIDHTGAWTPAQYAIDAGWDLDCIKATAEYGVSEEDAAGLTDDQQSELRVFCKNRVAETQVCYLHKQEHCSVCWEVA